MGKRAISMRVTGATDDWIQAMAQQLHMPRSVIMRAMLVVATEHPDEVQHKIEQLWDK